MPFTRFLQIIIIALPRHQNNATCFALLSLWQVITGAAEEEISLRENMDIVENEVKKELDKYDGDVDKVDEQTVSETLMELLKGHLLVFVYKV